MELTEKVSRNNYICFLWHATLLALTQNFMDVDTVVPAMMIDAGGTSVHIGLLTAILVGGGKLSQLLFAPFLSSQPTKKNLLLVGINARIVSLAGIGSWGQGEGASPQRIHPVDAGAGIDAATAAASGEPIALG